MRISIELVPRGIEHLQSELQLIKAKFPSINTVNIPDLMRLDIRSWEGTAISKTFYDNCIPHIRAINFDLNKNITITEYLNLHRISEILVITGDHPQDINRKVYPVTSTDFIKKIKSECPNIKVYAAIDPYRNSIRKEYEYVQQKLDAGTDGFFTQPFFDIRLMEVYMELLEGSDIFWGVSPVTSLRSRNYWEVKNNAVFPKSFEPTLQWNIDFARRALDFSHGTNSHIYFMPIKTDLETYLAGIFS
ncbi:methylenetetrahydrofolate reductase [Paenibacillus radicis (ex Xue et al. 2023)]|uniref:Methylenetetrahydrofolate reductase n=1 Tax=Paenibacillus radicis (ex Xue et al. 2023) TaxID=2972489 RepID=A0ABT1YKR8_9BACL|nr:methylenetetrahydrofolate reductase [Paenibacillus radicis (ex Xue et al. 2023)]MCR8633787.1 methylenetetrahydrofolate reductase [Paenibacillus radicis (ex Xue et al. 2023)]